MTFTQQFRWKDNSTAQPHVNKPIWSQEAACQTVTSSNRMATEHVCLLDGVRASAIDPSHVKPYNMSDVLWSPVCNPSSPLSVSDHVTGPTIIMWSQTVVVRCGHRSRHVFDGAACSRHGCHLRWEYEEETVAGEILFLLLFAPSRFSWSTLATRSGRFDRHTLSAKHVYCVSFRRVSNFRLYVILNDPDWATDWQTVHFRAASTSSFCWPISSHRRSASGCLFIAPHLSSLSFAVSTKIVALSEIRSWKKYFCSNCRMWFNQIISDWRFVHNISYNCVLIALSRCLWPVIITVEMRRLISREVLALRESSESFSSSSSRLIGDVLFAADLWMSVELFSYSKWMWSKCRNEAKYCE